MNAHCERFNRTVQDEFIDYHHDLLFLDELTDFNLELLRWLSWYNLERPHFSLTEPVLGRKTPRLLSPVQFLHQHHQCNMYWPDTRDGRGHAPAGTIDRSGDVAEWSKALPC